MKTCTIIENGVKCERKHAGRGMCKLHWERWKRHGDPLKVKYVREIREHEKWCPRCEAWLPHADFSPNAREKSGLEAWCKSCGIDRSLQARYGITKSQFDQILADQGGVCAICSATEPGGHGAWHVDHDHACCPGEKSCGECVRALLCMPCNMGLGYLGDDPDRLFAAAFYLIRHAQGILPGIST